MNAKKEKIFKTLVLSTFILSCLFLIFTAVFLPLILLGKINGGLWYPILSGIIALINLVLGISCIVVYKQAD